MEVCLREIRWVWECSGKEGDEQSEMFEGKLKKFKKLTHFVQNTRFSWLSQVAFQSPGPTTRTLERKLLKKFSKCFSQMEVPLARESRTEPRKSLCTPHNWTFHPRTSRQPKLRKTWNSNFLKNILSLFRDWSIYPPMSRQWVMKNLYDGLATGEYDWFYPRLSRQNRAIQFLTIFAKTKYFPKTTKTLKNIFVIDQQRLSMWNTFNQV